MDASCVLDVGWRILNLVVGDETEVLLLHMLVLILIKTMLVLFHGISANTFIDLDRFSFSHPFGDSTFLLFGFLAWTFLLEDVFRRFCELLKVLWFPF